MRNLMRAASVALCVAGFTASAHAGEYYRCAPNCGTRQVVVTRHEVVGHYYVVRHRNVYRRVKVGERHYRVRKPIVRTVHEVVTREVPCTQCAIDIAVRYIGCVVEDGHTYWRYAGYLNGRPTAFKMRTRRKAPNDRIRYFSPVRMVWVSRP